MTTVLSQYIRSCVGGGTILCACGLVPMTLPCHGRDRGLKSRHALQLLRRACGAEVGAPKPWRRRTRSNQPGPIVSTPARASCKRAVRVEIPVGPPISSGRKGVRHLRPSATQCVACGTSASRTAPEPDPVSTRRLTDRMRACEVRDGGSSPPESAIFKLMVCSWQELHFLSTKLRTAG